MRQATDLGIKARFFATNTIQSPACLKRAGSAARGAIVSTWLAAYGENYAAWRGSFEKLAGHQPNFEVSAVPTYDVSSILVRHLMNGGTFNAAEVSKKLHSVRDYAGVSGAISIDQDGATRTLSSRPYVYDGVGLIAMNGAR